jgi:hypothetical protein
MDHIVPSITGDIPLYYSCQLLPWLTESTGVESLSLFIKFFSKIYERFHNLFEHCIFPSPLYAYVREACNLCYDFLSDLNSYILNHGDSSLQFLEKLERDVRVISLQQVEVLCPPQVM